MKNIILIIYFVALSIPTLAQITDQTILINSEQFERLEELTWSEIEFNLIATNSLEDHDIFYPHALTANEQGVIAVMAWDNRSVFIFEKENLSKTLELGTRRGRGPKEYEHPFDMYLTNTGKLWISDINLRKIDVWDIHNQHLKNSFVIENRFIKPDQIIQCENSTDEANILYVLSTQYGVGKNSDEGILHQYVVEESKLDLIKTFQELSSTDERYPYVITGDINCSADGELFYSGDFTGTIRKYNRSGELLYHRTASNYIVEEPLFFKNDNSTRFNPEAPRINGGIFLVDDLLFVSRSRNTDRKIYGVDVYSTTNGNYLRSFELPAPAKEIVLISNRLVTIEYTDDGGYSLGLYSYNFER